MVDGRNVEVKRAVPRGDDDPARQRPFAAPGIAPRPPLSSLGIKRVPGGSMSTKIFVGGISWSTTDEEFLKHFERYDQLRAARNSELQQLDLRLSLSLSVAVVLTVDACAGMARLRRRT